MAKKIASTNATKNFMGFEYQKFIAVKMCFEAPINSTIWLECKGDIADEVVSTEVKSHLSEHYITDNCVDVWKTLKNYIESYSDFSSYEHLVLHTTSQIRETSFFHGWNTLGREEKYSYLIEHNPVKTITKFHKFIIEAKEEEVLEILDLFSIESGQPKLHKLNEDLLAHSFLRLVRSEYKQQALNAALGSMTTYALKDLEEWQINIKDFTNDMRHLLAPFTGVYIEFPFVEEQDINSKEVSFSFVSEMQKISLLPSEQRRAVEDFLRSKLSQDELLSLNPRLEKELVNYDDDVLRDLEDEKRLILDDDGKREVKSRKLYRTSIKRDHKQIPTVNNTRKYYKDGRIHFNVEEGHFSWDFEEED